MQTGQRIRIRRDAVDAILGEIAAGGTVTAIIVVCCYIWLWPKPGEVRPL